LHGGWSGSGAKETRRKPTLEPAGLEFGTICSEIVAYLGGRDQPVDIALAILPLGAAVVLKIGVVAPVEAQVSNLGPEPALLRLLALRVC